MYAFRINCLLRQQSKKKLSVSKVLLNASQRMRLISRYRIVCFMIQLAGINLVFFQIQITSKILSKQLSRALGDKHLSHQRELLISLKEQLLEVLCCIEKNMFSSQTKLGQSSVCRKTDKRLLVKVTNFENKSKRHKNNHSG